MRRFLRLFSVQRWVLLGGVLMGSMLTTGVVLYGVGCSGGADEQEQVVDEETPAPPPLLPAEPATLFVVQVREGIMAPPGPSWSPFDRDLPAVPAAGPDPEFLRTEGQAANGTGELLEAWQRGEFPSGADLALVEWLIHWGAGGVAGTGRLWGACVLPCRIEDDFVATAKHHPADAVRSVGVLFAGRPGATDLELSRNGDGLVVKHGADVLWAGGAAGPTLRKEGQMVGVLRSADGTDGDARRIRTMRALRVADVQQSSLPESEVTERMRASAASSPRSPESVRVLPALPVPGPEEVARHRAVEGEMRYWPWLEASEFEGGFAIRPDPGLEGLTIERQEQRIQWIPTARQAGEGRVDFVTYSLARAGVSAMIAPFPGGVEVLTATPTVDQKMIIAALPDEDSTRRAEGVKREFERFQELLPLPDREGPRAIVYLSETPGIVVPGGDGEGQRSFVVSSRNGEGWSLASVWARMLLGPEASSRTTEVRDFVAWARSRLLGSEDSSLWTAAFAEAGDDVLEVWLEGLMGGGKTSTSAGFLDYVAVKIPSLAKDLRKSLALRQAALDAQAIASSVAEGQVATVTVEAKGGTRSQVVAVEVPAVGEVQLKIDSSANGNLSWLANIVSTERWKGGQGSVATRVDLVKAWAEPLAKSEGSGAGVGWTAPVDTTKASSAGTVPRVVMVLLWGQQDWQAAVEVQHLAPTKPDEAAAAPK